MEMSRLASHNRIKIENGGGGQNAQNNLEVQGKSCFGTHYVIFMNVCIRAVFYLGGRIEFRISSVCCADLASTGANFCFAGGFGTGPVA